MDLYAFLSCFPDKLSLSDFFQVSEFSMSFSDHSPQENMQATKVSVLNATQCHRCRRYLVFHSDEFVTPELCDLCNSYLC